MLGRTADTAREYASKLMKNRCLNMREKNRLDVNLQVAVQERKIWDKVFPFYQKQSLLHALLVNL